MGEAVYLLCALTSCACAVLLWRGWRRSRTRLLLWCAVAFAGLFVANAVLFVDLILVPDVDLSLARHVISLGAMIVFVAGLTLEDLG